ncbi:MAG: extracellular solute-binding protein [Candidatus Yonathbacteria bacterium]|nr:extracellular solute-binding protein [Candidatus Yonathbacteria bacterium]
MQKPKIFQMIIIGVFVVFVIFGFLGFSGKLPLPMRGGDVNYGEVILWGSIPVSTMQTLISDNFRDEKSVSIKYVEKNAETINRDFIEALASGKGPDIILIAQDEIIKNLDKFSLISYQTVLERDFKNTFIEEGEMFLRPNGVIALPFTIDPIVMYWNRDIFTSALIPSPPAFWADFYNLVPEITVLSQGGDIVKSLVSFGGYRNVSHAKEIVSILMMQAGSPIVFNQNGRLSAALVISNPTNAENPVITAMRFYTEFSKPDKDSYSWNRSLPESRAMFEAGDLALYFGYASEYQPIKQKNPHLNFDVAVVPQIGRTSTKLTFGRMRGIAIVAASKNPNGAFRAASLLSGKNVVNEIGTLLGTPPVRRDLIGLQPAPATGETESANPPADKLPDAALSVFYDSALISRGWFDPSPNETNQLFMTMFDNVTSGRSSMTEALAVAHSSLEKFLQSY